MFRTISSRSTGISAKSMSEDSSDNNKSSQAEAPPPSTKPVVKHGENRSPGSVYDFYQVTRLLGGSENSGVYVCQRKAKRGYASSQGFWKKKKGAAKKRGGAEEEFVLKYLRINTLDDDVTAESLQRFFVMMDKVKALRHTSIVRVSSRPSVDFEFKDCGGCVLIELKPHCSLLPAGARILRALWQSVHDHDILLWRKSSFETTILRGRSCQNGLYNFVKRQSRS
jgi:hypothetical protein